MKKGTMMVFSALLMSCFLAVSAEAKSIENGTYRVCKNDIFIDYDQLNCKKIVTKVKDDGSFTAIDLGEASDEFCDSEDTSYIDFQGLVYEGDVIRSTDSFQETVTEVSFDGSFYTETEMTGLYVDGKTTRIK